MRIQLRSFHDWNLQPKQAIEVQERLRNLVQVTPLVSCVELVAGVDVHQDRAAVVVLSYPQLKPVEWAVATKPITFPYIPGLLSFREVPAILEALGQLDHIPDLILCDGQGYAHPRRFGLACHLGVLIDLPTIGVAKSLLVGAHEPLGFAKGSWAPLVDRDEVIGAAVRTRNGVAPVYVSVGHKVDLPSAIEWVLRCCRQYRLPETTRFAHCLARQGRYGER